jgi:hypothetical protein
LTIIQQTPGTLDLFQDVVGLSGPDERFRILIVAVEVVSDSRDQLLEIPEYTSPQSVLRQIAEETLDLV